MLGLCLYKKQKEYCIFLSSNLKHISLFPLPDCPGSSFSFLDTHEGAHQVLRWMAQWLGTSVCRFCKSLKPLITIYLVILGNSFYYLILCIWNEKGVLIWFGWKSIPLRGKRNSSEFGALAEECFGASSDKRMNLNSSDVFNFLPKESHDKLCFFFTCN